MQASKKLSLSKIAAHLNSAGFNTQISGDPDVLLGLSSPTSAGPDSIVFWFSGCDIPDNIVNLVIDEKAYVKSKSEKPTPRIKNLLVVNGNIKLAFAYATHLFADHDIAEAKPGLSYIASTAKISPKARISSFVHIGENSSIGDGCLIYPFAYVGDNVSIAEGTILKPQCVVLNDTVIGKYCLIESGAVIGGDGFGFVREKNKTVKIEHLGKVIIGDFVEVNANTTIDRGTLDDTLIGDYTKLDNLVQIAHNNNIGSGNFVAALTGLSGSIKVGNNNTIAGQVGASEGITIGDNNMIGGKSGVTKDIGSNQIISGFPARPHKEELVRQANLAKVEKLAEKIKELEDEIEDLKKKIDAKND